MKLGDLQGKWGGSFAGTLQRIARERMEAREREEKEKGGVVEEANGKRWVTHFWELCVSLQEHMQNRFERDADEYQKARDRYDLRGQLASEERQER
jgi:hypothetical protein